MKFFKRKPKYDLPAKAAGEYEKLKFNVFSLNPGQKVKTVLVSCSVPGEGSSMVAADLAISLAQSTDSRVLLVDGNLRSPFIHKRFQLKQEDGLADFVAGKEKKIVKRTGKANLFVITSGVTEQDPERIFSSGRLKGLLPKIKDKFDYVLFDSPPVTGFPDAGLVAPLLDGVILVVEAEKTPVEYVQEARKRIEAHKGKILGVVLNKSKSYIPAFLERLLGL